MKSNFKDDVMFEINEDDEQIYKKNLSNYDEVINKIVNFNFDKYKEYLDEINNKVVLGFDDLREDEEQSNESQKNNLLQNAISYDDGYVVVNNENKNN